MSGSETRGIMLTIPQAIALHKVYMRMPLYIDDTRENLKDQVTSNIQYENQQSLDFEQFTALIQLGTGDHVLGMQTLMVPWCGMWLGIEPDGYTHS